MTIKQIEARLKSMDGWEYRRCLNKPYEKKLKELKNITVADIINASNDAAAEILVALDTAKAASFLSAIVDTDNAKAAAILAAFTDNAKAAAILAAMDNAKADAILDAMTDTAKASAIKAAGSTSGT